MAEQATEARTTAARQIEQVQAWRQKFHDELCHCGVPHGGEDGAIDSLEGCPIGRYMLHYEQAVLAIGGQLAPEEWGQQFRTKEPATRPAEATQEQPEARCKRCGEPLFVDAHGFGPPEVPNQHDFDWGAEATQGEGVRDIAARILGVFLGSYNPATGDTALPAAIGAIVALVAEREAAAMERARFVGYNEAILLGRAELDALLEMVAEATESLPHHFADRDNEGFCVVCGNRKPNPIHSFEAIGNASLAS